MIKSQFCLALLTSVSSVTVFSPAVQAACVSSDCNAMGYTKSASYCDGDIIRCPFDTSKVFCKEGCRVSNCAVCSDGDPNYCSTCYPGYNWEYGQCTIAPQMVNLTVCVKNISCPSYGSDCSGYAPSIYVSFNQGNIHQSLMFSPTWDETQCISAEINGNDPVEISFQPAVELNMPYWHTCATAQPEVATGYLSCSDTYYYPGNSVQANFQPDPNALNNKVTFNYERYYENNGGCQRFSGLESSCRVKQSY